MWATRTKDSQVERISEQRQVFFISVVPQKVARSGGKENQSSGGRKVFGNHFFFRLDHKSRLHICYQLRLPGFTKQYDYSSSIENYYVFSSLSHNIHLS